MKGLLELAMLYMQLGKELREIKGKITKVANGVARVRNHSAKLENRLIRVETQLEMMTGMKPLNPDEPEQPRPRQIRIQKPQ